MMIAGCAILEELIDGNTFKVEDYQITASSIFSEAYSTPNLKLTASNSWCSEEGQAPHS